MIRQANQQVSPKAAAAIILAVLILIQMFWWRGLVMKTPGVHTTGAPNAGAGLRGAPPVLIGRRDVQVDTLTGGLDPGDTDGPGNAARFDTPLGLALDAQGNLYVADSRNHRIRIVAPNGDTSTLAGNGQGYADGPVATAQFNLPCGVAVGPDGAVYVADTGNNRLRRIKDGQVTTLAGNAPGLAEGQGEGKGGGVKFNSPCAVAYVAGSKPGLLVADALNRRVRILTLTGATAGEWQVSGTPVGVAVGAAAASGGGLIFAGAKPLTNIPINMQGESGGTQADYTLRHPVALCSTPQGWFVIDSDHGALFSVHDGQAEVIAGHCQGRNRVDGWVDGDGHRAQFGQIAGIVADGHRHLYISDTSNNLIRRITLPPDLGAEDGRRFPER